MVSNIFNGILNIIFFVLGALILYMVNLGLSMLLSSVWQKFFGYDLFLPAAPLAVPAVYITTTATAIIIASLSWNRSRALAWGAIIGAVPLIFIHTFA